MPLILQGATSGQATLQATDAQTVTITMPATSGTLVTTGGAQTIEFADGSASAPSITNSGDTNTGMFFPAADTIAFTEGGTESMRIDSAGRVMIGNTSAGSFDAFGNQLVVGNGSASQGVTVYSGTTSTGNIVFADGTSGTALYQGIIQYAHSVDAMDFYVNYAGNSNPRMRIDSSGNVGIGTSSPAYKLDVVVTGTGEQNIISARTTGGGGQGLLLGVNTTNTVTTIKNNTGSGYGMAFYSGGGSTENMRINSSGRILIGKTSATNSTNGVELFYNSFFTNTDSYSALFNRKGSNGEAIFFQKDEVNVGNISVTTTATAYNTSSDYRLKENIAPMTGALATVAQLKPRTYTWKASGEDSQGFIAHELQAVVPDCVTGEKDGMRTEQYEVSPAIPATYDEEGNELTPAVEAVMGEREVPDYQGIDTSFLVATLTAAIQEQQAIITDLKARIETLENK
jgi:hypothetical protein